MNEGGDASLLADLEIPHAAFHGQTPDEIYFGTGAAIPDELAERRKKARQARLDFNRRARCGLCRY